MSLKDSPMCNVHGSRYFFMDSNFQQSSPAATTTDSSVPQSATDDIRLVRPATGPVSYDRLGRIVNLRRSQSLNKLIPTAQERFKALLRDREYAMELENKKYDVVEEELKNVGSDVPNSNEEGSSEDTSEMSPESDYHISEMS